MKSEPSMGVLQVASMAPQQVSIDVLLEKYAKGDESTETEIFARVAKGVAQAEQPELREKFERVFFENMMRGAIGAGRIMSAAGTGIKATLANCFVQPVGDAIQGVDAEGYPGIYEALREAAETMRRGGGVGYDFSRIRPRGSVVKGTASSASGPCSYIDVFDASCKTVESAGARRGAQMGVMKISQPACRLHGSDLAEPHANRRARQLPRWSDGRGSCPPARRQRMARRCDVGTTRPRQ